MTVYTGGRTGDESYIVLAGHLSESVRLIRQDCLDGVHFVVDGLVQDADAKGFTFSDFMEVLEKGCTDEAGVCAQDAMSPLSPNWQSRTEQVTGAFGQRVFVGAVEDRQVGMDGGDTDPAHHSTWSHIQQILVGV